MPTKLTQRVKNKIFWSKSPAKQRVAVAKDVLTQLDLKFFKAERGTYAALETPLEEVKVLPQLDKVFDKLKRDGGFCTVCGIGSCFVSLVNIGDKCAAENHLPSTGEMFPGYEISDYGMREHLKKVFEPRQLSMIESAFEKSYFFDQNDEYDIEDLPKEILKSIKFGEKYKTDEGRLRGIMNNIIKNNGTFKP